MRQKDKVFAELLNRLREGNHTSDDLNILSDRILQNDSDIRCTKYESLPHLYTTRRS